MESTRAGNPPRESRHLDRIARRARSTSHLDLPDDRYHKQADAGQSAPGDPVPANRGTKEVARHRSHDRGESVGPYRQTSQPGGFSDAGSASEDSPAQRDETR